MLNSVDEIRTLREEVRAEMGTNVGEDDINKWVSTHTGIDADALLEYLDTDEFPNEAKAAFFVGVQIGAAARERVKE